ncbi:MAG: hypothetical protein O3A25_15745 [Acidobacteria bacterium]|nr:hypothetical protein [Acidobacteriota bacterium]
MVRSLHDKMWTSMQTASFHLIEDTMPASLTGPRVTGIASLSRVVVVLMLTVAPASATPGPDEQAATQPAPTQDLREPDFLFSWPRTFVGVSGGWLATAQRGGIFDLTRELLTVEDGDFDSGVALFSFGRALSRRVDVSAEVGFSHATVASEYRDFLEGDLPITQTTEFSQAPVSANLRLWLVPRGRSIGRFAWVPASVAPYVSGGVGTHWYRFRQLGDFVDIVDASIFSDILESSGWAAGAHVAGGISAHMVKQLFLTVEARYTWAATPLSEDFVGFEDIDLDGFQVTGGVEFAF